MNDQHDRLDHDQGDDLDLDRKAADRRAEESDRRQWLHDYERHIARQPQQPGPGRLDPIHLLRVHLHDQPGIAAFGLARWSTAARLIRDAEGSGDVVTDLGPRALVAWRGAQYVRWGAGDLAWWLAWTLPRSPEHVPGPAPPQTPGANPKGARP